MRRECPRCGVVRTVNIWRAGTGLCRDCWTVENERIPPPRADGQRCTVEDCERPRHARGLGGTHYRAAHRAGALP